eukprot:Sdes_comp20868_c0_seq1m17777
MKQGAKYGKQDGKPTNERIQRIEKEQLSFKIPQTHFPFQLDLPIYTKNYCDHRSDLRSETSGHDAVGTNTHDRISPVIVGKPRGYWESWHAIEMNYGGFSLFA